MSKAPDASPPIAPTREAWFLGGVFALALLYHLHGVTYHWTVGFLAGNEFRQAQTAIISYYIDQQNNFSLLYETPVLGKPWISNLMEVPVYEWAVVLLSRATGWPHFIAARTISAASFYAMLPAVYLLLGRLAVAKPRRLLVLALVLVAPVYVYYARAFLMDAMALTCSVWFLLGFVRTMDRRSGGWLTLTVVAGTGAALIKSAVFAAWLIPGAAYGAWLLWRDVRARTGWMAPLKTLAWGAATVVVALGSLRWWVLYTDPIKDAHASAWIFSSKALVQGNWGLFDGRAILSAEVWRFWMKCWEQAIMSRWVIGAGLALGLVLPTARRRVLGAGALFFLAQFLFPYAYAYQDYYYYACAIYVLAALGFTLLGLLDTRAPRWLVGLIFLVPFAGEVNAYRREYYREQSKVFSGDLPFTAALRELTPKNTVLVVAGADWAAMTPYYAQRRALMVRNGLEFDQRYLHRAFQELADEEVSALVLFGALRTNQELIQLAAARFDLDAGAPTFSSATVDVYVARSYARAVRTGLQDRTRYPDLTVHAPAPAEVEKNAEPVTPQLAREVFADVTPAPFKMRFHFGAGREGAVILAHPYADLWLAPARDAARITWGYGILPGAYANPRDRTDGVEFGITGELPDGRIRRIYRRLLDPAQNPQDRGEQNEIIPYHPLPGEVLRFSTRNGGSTAYDWSYWSRIEVK